MLVGRNQRGYQPTGVGIDYQRVCESKKNSIHAKKTVFTVWSRLCNIIFTIHSRTHRVLTALHTLNRRALALATSQPSDHRLTATRPPRRPNTASLPRYQLAGPAAGLRV